MDRHDFEDRPRHYNSWPLWELSLLLSRFVWPLFLREHREGRKVSIQLDVSEEMWSGEGVFVSNQEIKINSRQIDTSPL